TVIRAPLGACTLSSRNLTPEGVAPPAMRTIGKGCITISGRAVTAIVSAATLESPPESVTRRRTRWLPGLANEVVIDCAPATNAPPPVRSHASAVIGLAASVEVEASDTRSPGCGLDGNHKNEAAGGAGASVGVAAGCCVTVKLVVGLTPWL